MCPGVYSAKQIPCQPSVLRYELLKGAGGSDSRRLGRGRSTGRCAYQFGAVCSGVSLSLLLQGSAEFGGGVELKLGVVFAGYFEHPFTFSEENRLFVAVKCDGSAFAA